MIIINIIVLVIGLTLLAWHIRDSNKIVKELERIESTYYLCSPKERLWYLCNEYNWEVICQGDKWYFKRAKTLMYFSTDLKSEYLLRDEVEKYCVFNSLDHILSVIEGKGYFVAELVLIEPNKLLK
jgi:hypothetical protein